MTDYRICNCCIMDTTDPDIVFDDNGVCNHCLKYARIVSQRLVLNPDDRKIALDNAVAEMKRQGKGKDYDCVIGVSGGVDSTYVAYLTKELGLRPLAVHFDNGWNSELAVANIEKTLSKLGVDLDTYVVDWPEFRDLQMSFLKASTPDGEVPTDHAIAALLYRKAHKHGLKYILTGVNVISESVMPIRWGYGYSDMRYIGAVQKQFGNKKLKTYPHYSLPQLYYYMKFRQIKMFPILDYVPYDKDEAMALIENNLGWVYYGGKHYESIYTRFYQSQVLVEKFNIDKRRAHNSNLVLSGQMTRDAALKALDTPVCPPDLAASDKTYVLKKFGLTDNGWGDLMGREINYFSDYPNSHRLVEKVKKFI
jgi:N-acetyl sugar amidotransferase